MDNNKINQQPTDATQNAPEPTESTQIPIDNIMTDQQYKEAFRRCNPRQEIR